MGYSLASAHFGNGLTVWFVGTNTTVAHIAPNRTITYYKEELDKEQIKYIENLAKTDDRNISVTQDIKVFNDRPKTIDNGKDI